MIKALLISALLILTSLYAPAQDGEEMTYRLRAKLPINLTYKYKFSEVSRVTKQLFTGEGYDSLEYDRKVDIYYTRRSTSKRPDDFTEVDLKIDSIVYSLTKPSGEVFYRSSDYRNFPPINEKDYLRYGISTEVDYDLLYSPYSEVSKVISPRLEENRKLFTDPMSGDALSRRILGEFLVDRMIVFLYDPIKNILPDKDISLEEKWNPEVDIEMDGFWWTMKPEFAISSYDRSGFLIESTFDSLEVPKTNIFFQDLKLDGTITNGTASGIISKFLTTHGTPESVVMNINLNLEGDIGARKFYQQQDIFYSWELLGTYQF